MKQLLRALALILLGSIVLSACRNAESTQDVKTMPESLEDAVWMVPPYFYYHGEYYRGWGSWDYEIPEGYEYAGRLVYEGEQTEDTASKKDFYGNQEAGAVYVSEANPDSIYVDWDIWDEEEYGPERFPEFEKETD